MSTDVLRPTFYWINGVVYAIQMIFKNSAHEEELTSQVKGWIRSWDNETINVLDVISNFPDISMELVEGLRKWFLSLCMMITSLRREDYMKKKHGILSAGGFY
ncbi:hypothetical protein ZEAMMB73_Zm00001d010524 [Zea mays]|uniref:Uncharacterized protein n=1 Tax=Zea mays TaxID=4577 RepID=A0A1D6FRL7_MAIZE|nr:hypothetical protein ZEAMMB73_Zm00001d010524 [Zea mays]